MLRPLRAHARFPQLQRVAAALARSLPCLAQMLGLLCLYLALFSMVTVSIWSGALRNRCAKSGGGGGRRSGGKVGANFESFHCAPPDDARDAASAARESAAWCLADEEPSRGHVCDDDETCARAPNPRDGFVGFDNAPLAFATLFQVSRRLRPALSLSFSLFSRRADAPDPDEQPPPPPARTLTNPFPNPLNRCPGHHARRWPDVLLWMQRSVGEQRRRAFVVVIDGRLFASNLLIAKILAAFVAALDLGDADAAEADAADADDADAADGGGDGGERRRRGTRHQTKAEQKAQLPAEARARPRCARCRRAAREAKAAAAAGGGGGGAPPMARLLPVADADGAPGGAAAARAADGSARSATRAASSRCARSRPRRRRPRPATARPRPSRRRCRARRRRRRARRRPSTATTTTAIIATATATTAPSSPPVAAADHRDPEAAARDDDHGGASPPPPPPRPPRASAGELALHAEHWLEAAFANRCYQGLRDAPRARAAVTSDGSAFGVVVNACILANSLTLALDDANTSARRARRLFTFNAAMTAVFAAEASAKLAVLGVPDYCAERWNVFDLVVSVTSVGEVASALAGGGASGGGGGAARSACCASSGSRASCGCARLGKLRFRADASGALSLSLADDALKALPLLLPGCATCSSLERSVVAVWPMLVLFALACFIFALLGMQLFGRYGASLPERVRFDTFGFAAARVLLLLMGDDWSNAAHATMGATSPAAFGYFVLVVLVGRYALLNMVLAVLLDDTAKDLAAKRTTRRVTGHLLAVVQHQFKRASFAEWSRVSRSRARLLAVVQHQFKRASWRLVRRGRRRARGRREPRRSGRGGRGRARRAGARDARAGADARERDRRDHSAIAASRPTRTRAQACCGREARGELSLTGARRGRRGAGAPRAGPPARSPRAERVRR